MEPTASGPGHQDPYGVLGVDTGASRQDIARAYRHAVQGAHPDAQPANPRAAARFQELTDAYDLLSDPDRRAAYDRAHPAGGAGGQPLFPPRPPRVGRPGPPHLPVPTPGQPIVAGPVHIEPPAAAGKDDPAAAPPTAEAEDPPVILGLWTGRRWRQPW